jgi:hypothetical protein
VREIGETDPAAKPEPRRWDDDEWRLFHEEVGRLPQKYRVPYVLCDLEGVNPEEAAARLNLTVAGLRTRLDRARKLLKDRLRRRGVDPPWAGDLLIAGVARGPLPAGLIDCTVRGAVQFGAAGTVPAAVSSLTLGVLRAMFLTKLKVYATALLAVGAASVLAVGTVGFTQPPPQTKPPLPKPAAPGSKSPETATRARLDQPVPMVFPKEIPLKEVLKHIKQATKRGPLDPGLAIYVDPIGLQEVQRSLNSTVTLNVENTPLRDTLPQVLGQLGLSYFVKDGVLIISSPQGIDAERKEPLIVAKDDSPRTAAVLDQLAGPIPMSFPNEIPIEQVLAHIGQATTTRTSAGVPVLVDALALQEAERSLNSTVSIDVDGVPLRTTFGLVLRQHGLAYVVRDGLVIVSSPWGLQRLEGSPQGAASSKESPKK